MDSPFESIRFVTRWRWKTARTSSAGLRRAARLASGGRQPVDGMTYRFSIRIELIRDALAVENCSHVVGRLTPGRSPGERRASARRRHDVWILHSN